MCGETHNRRCATLLAITVISNFKSMNTGQEQNFNMTNSHRVKIG